jgi:hypothetical protein
VKMLDDWLKGDSAMPGDPSKSKPMRSITLGVFDRVGIFRLYLNPGTESCMSFAPNHVAAFFGRTSPGIFRSKCDEYQMLPPSRVGLAAFVTIWQGTPNRSPRNCRQG